MSKECLIVDPTIGLFNRGILILFFGLEIDSYLLQHRFLYCGLDWFVTKSLGNFKNSGLAELREHFRM